MRQSEKYPHVVLWGQRSWAFLCCYTGCHGCSGIPMSTGYDRPIDAYLAYLEWKGEVPVGPVRVVSQS